MNTRVLAILLSFVALPSLGSEHTDELPTLAWSYDEHMYPAPIYFRGKPIESSAYYRPIQYGTEEAPDLVVIFLSKEIHTFHLELALNFGFSIDEIQSVANGGKIKFKTNRYFEPKASIPPIGFIKKKALLLPADSFLSEFREDCVRDVILDAMLEVLAGETLLGCKHKADQ